MIFLPLRGRYDKGLDEVSGWCTDSEKMLWISRECRKVRVGTEMK
ncbi:conserved domain protein [Paraprevotella xylaniphila YIT 11841]|uniref:Conserved domain protein n=1 Tax=Paraprevotella xylaniphila YIT 11841 TaxID=762982 RepID=F3QQL9_9BACT|nr:conserved domain protein [Paraprevotella xylaniphila YIT 11841]